MKTIAKRSFLFALAFGLVAFTTSPLLAAKAKTEDDLIAQLSDANETKVVEALAALEKEFPTSTKAFPTMKKLLTDPREKVRRKAGRVLGVLHAEVDEQNIKDICAMLKAADPQEVMDALKSLRGLKAGQTVPQILPLLQNPNPGVIRDACRT